MERHLVDQLDAVVVSVHYRLAPEHPYPLPLNDCLTALAHLHQHATEFGIDPTKITIIGDSAGGNLAAAVTIKLRDTGHPFLHRQILLSPVTHFSNFLTRSCRDNTPYSFFIEPGFHLLYMNESAEYESELCADHHIPDSMTRHTAWPYLKKYHREMTTKVAGKNLSEIFAAKLLDPYLSPMMATSLRGLPPALVLVSEYDLFRDDGLAYADRLAAEGTETVVVRSHGFHGIYCFFDRSVSGGGMVRSVIDYLGGVYGGNVTGLVGRKM